MFPASLVPQENFKVAPINSKNRRQHFVFFLTNLPLESLSRDAQKTAYAFEFLGCS